MYYIRKRVGKVCIATLVAFVITALLMYQPVLAKRMLYDEPSMSDSVIARTYFIDYTVNKGDTLWRISQNYGVTLEDLKKSNNIRGDLIITGQILKIPQTVFIGYEDRQVVDRVDHKQMTVEVASYNMPFKEPKQLHLVKDDRYWLAKIIEAEAGIEPLEGKIAVGAVVLNRVKDDWFPDTIQEVIFQKLNGSYQFSPVGNGRLKKVEPSEEAYEAADRAIAGEDPTDGALYFYNPKISKSTFFKKKELLASIGNHQFFQ